ncbi:hypothetical protein ACIQWY_29680 [Streptomyces albidoflavus]
MSHNVADDTAQSEEPQEPTLVSLGLIGALAQAMAEHQATVIGPRKDAPKEQLVNGFAQSMQSDLVVQIGGQEIGRYKVNLSRDKFVVADEEQFDAYAEEKGEVVVTVSRTPAWEKAVLSHAEIDPDTGEIFDSRSGEVIPGLKFVPGGKPTGTVTWTWKSRKKVPVGKEALLAAWRRGELDDLLKDTPELLPGAAPSAEDV